MVHVGGTRWVAHTWGGAVGAGLATTSLGGAIGLMPGTACGTGHWPFYVGPWDQFKLLVGRTVGAGP
jgi:hypothetical protein